MSKAVEVIAPARPAGRERLCDVRLQAGGVHWGGARPVTHLTTDAAQRASLGTHIVVADEMFLHPAGVHVVIGDDAWIIPHARVEVYSLAK